MTTKTRANWRTPDATLIDVDENADRMVWLKERRNGIGGTDAAAIMGVHVTLGMSTAKDVTPADIFLDKTSTSDPVEDDKSIFAFGHMLEPVLMQHAVERFGITTRPGGFYRNKAEAWRYANPDGLSSDGGIVECKTASRRSESADKWLAGDVSPHAYIQTQHYLAVTGRSHSYYSVAIRDDFANWEAVPRHLWGEQWFADMAVKQFVQVGPVERDEAVIAHILDAEREFWGHVRAGVLPDNYAAALTPADRFPVGRKDIDVEAVIPEMTTDDLARLAVIKDQQTALADERSAIEARIKSEIGDAEYLTVGGSRRMRWSSYLASQFDKDRFGKDHPDLLRAYTTRRPARRLTVVGS